MPTVLSTYHGGMSPPSTLRLIERIHGRTSLYVASDIGAMPSVRWQISHFSWKMGAMSLAKVTAADPVCARAGEAASVASSATEDAATSGLINSRRDVSNMAYPFQALRMFLQRAVTEA